MLYLVIAVALLLFIWFCLYYRSDEDDNDPIDWEKIKNNDSSGLP